MKSTMLDLDGSMGEGGGQILRTSLALAMVTGTPVRIRDIRARRSRPGLMRQHLTAVQAAARVSGARIEGAEVGSREIAFTPGEVRPGDYRFDIGTAGSSTLILQTVLPALLHAGGPSRVTIAGGTHNPGAPPFDYLDRVFLPVLRRMGVRIEAALESPGFYPAGGGQLSVTIDPPDRLAGLELLERGEIRSHRAVAILSRLPRHVAERELDEVARETGWDSGSLEVREVDSPGPGNILLLEVESAAVTEIFAGFGEKGVRAEEVADRALRELRRYLDAGVPVGEHLADQLLLPFALAGAGAFATLPLSLHATTQIDLIPRFLDVRIEVEAEEAGRVVVRVRKTRT
jgi:RNA 3'-terminal phosphate cyclase (ATP)